MIDIQEKQSLKNQQWVKDITKIKIRIFNYFSTLMIDSFAHTSTHTLKNAFLQKHRPFGIFLEVKYCVDNLFAWHSINKCKKTLDKYYIRYLNDTANPLNTSHYTHKTIGYD